MGKVTHVRKKMEGSAVFLKLVRPLVFSDPACAENRVVTIHLQLVTSHQQLVTSHSITSHSLVTNKYSLVTFTSHLVKTDFKVHFGSIESVDDFK